MKNDAQNARTFKSGQKLSSEHCPQTCACGRESLLCWLNMSGA
jgi:hypothetical protein